MISYRLVFYLYAFHVTSVSGVHSVKRLLVDQSCIDRVMSKLNNITYLLTSSESTIGT